MPSRCEELGGAPGRRQTAGPHVTDLQERRHGDEEELPEGEEADELADAQRPVDDEAVSHGHDDREERTGDDHGDGLPPRLDPSGLDRTTTSVLVADVERGAGRGHGADAVQHAQPRHEVGGG